MVIRSDPHYRAGASAARRLLAFSQKRRPLQLICALAPLAATSLPHNLPYIGLSLVLYALGASLPRQPAQGALKRQHALPATRVSPRSERERRPEPCGPAMKQSWSRIPFPLPCCCSPAAASCCCNLMASILATGTQARFMGSRRAMGVAPGAATLKTAPPFVCPQTVRCLQAAPPLHAWLVWSHAAAPPSGLECIGCLNPRRSTLLWLQVGPRWERHRCCRSRCPHECHPRHSVGICNTSLPAPHPCLMLSGPAACLPAHPHCHTQPQSARCVSATTATRSSRPPTCAGGSARVQTTRWVLQCGGGAGPAGWLAGWLWVLLLLLLTHPAVSASRATGTSGIPGRLWHRRRRRP